MSKDDLYNLAEPGRLSRGWWLARARNAVFVTLVTVLVWVYADVEFTDEMELNATIQLAASPTSNLVLLSKGRIRVNFKVQGRRGSLERLEQRLQIPEAIIRYEVAEDEEDIPTRDILNRDPFLQSEGLTVLSASPSAVRVQLDTKIHVPDVPVKFEYTGAFPSEVTVEPPKMGLSVARSDWQRVLTAEATPLLRTVRVDLRSVEPDRPFPVQLIRRIGEVTVEPDQPTVAVRVKIAQLTETEEVTVPVQVVTPTTWMEDGMWKEYSLLRRDRAEWRVTLQVSGTRRDLDQLKGGDVQAYVVLTEDDKKPVSWLTRQVEVHLPQDLNLHLIGTRPSVTFKLEKIKPPGTT